MNNFLIIANKQKDINLEITEQIKHHITRMGAVCNVYDQYNRNVTSIDIPEGTQCILVIGGDGTILAAAIMLVGNTIPLLGINLGTLGFLADVNLADLSKTLDLLLKDQYQVENRIMLTAEVYKQGEKAATYIALNDFNINRCGASRVIGLKVGINGSTIDCYRADGVIVCTPTGSTGYNLSAGGPIINPTCKNFVITPICPHSLTARSIVLAKEDVVTVEVEQIRSNIKEEAIISFDGREGLSIVPGDQVKIYKSQEVTPFIKATEVSFVQILKEKLLYKEVEIRMKGQRQEKILEIIRTNDIETQEELTKKLSEAGFSSTQGTISRDIRELKLTKVTGANGKQKYAPIQTEDIHVSSKYKRVLSEGILHMDNAENILVIKTVPGMAMACAAAIDSISLHGVLGCIAGDDTIMCVVKETPMVEEVMKEIDTIMKGHR